MNTNDYTIRLERPEDYREVENLVRESFWNVYRPGCSEHYVIHVLRDDPAFVRELDFVMEQDGRLIGQDIFVRTAIHADDGKDIPIMTMGPMVSTGITRPSSALMIVRMNMFCPISSPSFSITKSRSFTKAGSSRSTWITKCSLQPGRYTFQNDSRTRFSTFLYSSFFSGRMI